MDGHAREMEIGMQHSHADYMVGAGEMLCSSLNCTLLAADLD